MDTKLLITGLTRFAAGVVLLGVLLFVPAGTLAWWRGWLLMGILFVPMLTAGFVMMAKVPDLLRKRLSVREEESEQRTVIALSGLMFLVAFVLAGLDHRFGWPTFLSRTIEVQEGQHVVDTGLYGIVRHPMYAVTLLLFLSMPVVLGSPFALIVMLAYPAIIAKRIRNEEQVLSAGLDGYVDYMERVRWRLVPFIW